MSKWSFLTNYGHVLAYIAQNPSTRIRDLAIKVDITERATQRIIQDLHTAGYLEKTKVGRRNVYKINTTAPSHNPVDLLSHNIETFVRLAQQGEP